MAQALFCAQTEYRHSARKRDRGPLRDHCPSTLKGFACYRCRRKGICRYASKRTGKGSRWDHNSSVASQKKAQRHDTLLSRRSGRSREVLNAHRISTTQSRGQVLSWILGACTSEPAALICTVNSLYRAREDDRYCACNLD